MKKAATRLFEFKFSRIEREKVLCERWDTKRFSLWKNVKVLKVLCERWDTVKFKGGTSKQRTFGFAPEEKIVIEIEKSWVQNKGVERNFLSSNFRR